MAREFRNRARKFPALVSCTVIDWFQPWPKEALESVGTRFLAKSCYLDGEGIRAGVEQFMMKSFEGVNAMCTKVGPLACAVSRYALSRLILSFLWVLYYCVPGLSLTYLAHSTLPTVHTVCTVSEITVTLLEAHSRFGDKLL